jgi:signal transduction histidine kinase
MLRASGDVPARWLLGITPIVVGGFVAASLYSARAMRAIENDAVSVVENGAPSIERLSACRSIVRHMETNTGLAMGDLAEGRNVEPSFLAVDTRQLQDALRASEALPFYPDERVVYEGVLTHLRRFRMADEHVVDLLARRQLADARRILRYEMHPEADATSEALTALINLNAAQVAAAAGRVVKLRPRVDAISLLLHGLAAVLALLLVWLAWRAIRSAERAVEERRQHAEDRAKELEQFAGRVAHDLKSPLAAIMLRVQMAQMRGDASVAPIERQLRSMSTLIEGLLDFAVAGARPGPGARTELERVVADLLPALNAEARYVDATLSVETLPPLTLACGPGAFTSILSNLVRNAIKFVAGRPVRAVSLRASRADDTVRLEIEDTGPGIPPGQERRLFEPFVRLAGSSDVPGIGLGLATVRRLVEGYGGHVGVSSVFGSGATFWVELPLAPARHEDAPAAAAPP